MERKIVYDVETQKAFDEVTKRNPEKLGISVIAVYDYSDGEYKTFREENIKELWPLFESADLIIGFNQKHFDNKVLNAYYPGDLSIFPHLDLLEEFYKSAGFRARLDDLAFATLGKRKSSHGLQAIKWFKEGNFEALAAYCKQDVLVTKELYEYALLHGHLKYREINEIKEVALNTSGWDKIRPMEVNYTLPF